MENNTFPSQFQEGRTIVMDATSVRTFLANVFSYMILALVISGVMAWWFAMDESMSSVLRTFNENGGFKPTGIGYVVMFAPLVLVFVMAGMVQRLNSTLLLAIFLIYSALTGMSLSSIFIVYQLGSIYTVFFMAAGLFAVMAIAGYTTKTDLTKLGSILFIGLIGIIIASVINMFIGSSTMDYIVSILGVIIFTGLTAYDMQKLKGIGEQVATGSETAQKMALMGALSLYLDFINLFLLLLRLFGGRKD